MAPSRLIYYALDAILRGHLRWLSVNAFILRHWFTTISRIIPVRYSCAT
jgi:hypothetical protein